MNEQTQFRTIHLHQPIPPTTHNRLFRVVRVSLCSRRRKGVVVCLSQAVVCGPAVWWNAMLLHRPSLYLRAGKIILIGQFNTNSIQAKDYIMGLGRHYIAIHQNWPVDVYTMFTVRLWVHISVHIGNSEVLFFSQLPLWFHVWHLQLCGHIRTFLRTLIHIGKWKLYFHQISYRTKFSLLILKL